MENMAFLLSGKIGEFSGLRRGIKTVTKCRIFKPLCRIGIKVVPGRPDNGVKDVGLAEHIIIPGRGLVEKIEQLVHIFQHLTGSNQVEPVQGMREAPLGHIKFIPVGPGNIQIGHRMEEFFIDLQSVPAADKAEFAAFCIKVGDTECDYHHNNANRDYEPVFEHLCPTR